MRLYINFFLGLAIASTKETKIHTTTIHDLDQGALGQIFDRLDDHSQQQFVSSSKELYKFLHRSNSLVEVMIPFKNSKKPTKFLCGRLQYEKNLKLSVRNDYKWFTGFLLGPKEIKFLKCLNGIESLEIDSKNVPLLKKIDLNRLFPKLKHLSFALQKYKNGEILHIPKNLESLNLDILKYFDEPIVFKEISQIFVKQPFFKRLYLKVYPAYPESLNLVSKHLVALEVHVLQFYQKKYVTAFLDQIPTTIESFTLFTYGYFVEPQAICKAISTLNNLKVLKFLPYDTLKLDCLLEALPQTLQELYLGYRDFSDENIMTLPKNLHTILINNLKASLLKSLADQVQHLTIGTILDLDNLEGLQSFKGLKTFEMHQNMNKFSLDHIRNLYNLLSGDMDLVYWRIYCSQNLDLQEVEQLLLINRKRIKKFIIQIRPDYSIPYYQEFFYDGLKTKKRNILTSKYDQNEFLS